MVPHRQALRTIALVGMASPLSRDVVTSLCQQYNVRFPGSLETFVKNEVLAYLTPELESLFCTTDFCILYDYRPFIAAARHLNLDRFVCISGTGPAVNFSPTIETWRQNKSIRVFLETSLLCGIDKTQIGEDLRRVFGIDINDVALNNFAELFVERAYAVGDGWLDYMRCVGEEDAKFKRGLMDQPTDYVRWTLGVPVSLAPDKVLDRLISDAYFTERMIKAQAGEKGINLGKDEMARIKMERDTIFKGMEQRRRMKETDKSAGQGGPDDALSQLRKIVLTYEKQDFPLVEEVVDEMNLERLARENDSTPGG